MCIENEKVSFILLTHFICLTRVNYPLITATYITQGL